MMDITPVSFFGKRIFFTSNPIPAPNAENNKEIKTSIFFVNDLHGKIRPMASLKQLAQNFDNQHSNYDVDSFKLAGGDMKVGLDKDLNRAAMLFMENIGFDLSALGNHEFDCGTERFSEQLNNIDIIVKKVFGFEKSRLKFVAANIDPSDTSLSKHFYKEENIPVLKEDGEWTHSQKKIFKSCIIEKHGHKYGFVGAAPTNLLEKLDEKSDSKIKVKDRANTIIELQNEVNRLKQQGAKIIILLSHEGSYSDMHIAANTVGINVILGGHTHDQVRQIRFNKAGKPVLIIQAGRNGFSYAEANLKFIPDPHEMGSYILDVKSIPDQATIIKNVHAPHAGWENNPFLDSIIGSSNKAKTIGQLAYDYQPVIERNKENPLASLFADAVRKKAFKENKAEIVLLVNNHDLTKEYIPQGIIYDRTILNLSPFRSKVYYKDMKGEDILKILSWGSASLINQAGQNKGFDKKAENIMPGLIQVSGIKYTATPNLKNKVTKKDPSTGNEIKQYEQVRNVILTDLEGNERISTDSKGNNTKFLDADKTYRVVFDRFLIKSAIYAKNKEIAKILGASANMTPSTDTVIETDADHGLKEGYYTLDNNVKQYAWDKEYALIEFIAQKSPKRTLWSKMNPFNIKPTGRITVDPTQNGINGSNGNVATLPQSPTLPQGFAKNVFKGSFGKVTHRKLQKN